jgi:hypothetical protein
MWLRPEGKMLIQPRGGCNGLSWDWHAARSKLASAMSVLTLGHIGFKVNDFRVNRRP